MKKIVAIMLAGILCAGVLTGCGGSTGAAKTEDTKEEAVESTEGAEGAATAESAEEGRVFTVGFDAEYPPYGYKDETTGDYTGFDLELAEEVCKRRGWTLKKQPIDWDAKDMEINSGAIDCLWNGMTYNGRENDYTWSEPYVDNTIVIAVNADSDIQTQADLAGKMVVAQAASSADTALNDNPELKDTFSGYETIKDYNDAFMQMDAGVYDAIAVDIGVAQYQLAANEGKYRILEEPISTEQYAIAFAKGNTELRDQVQETLNEMAADGTVEKIVANYADYNLPAMLIIGK
ncbi:MAG: amino acid ABC transporter substrate-binding protein [Lachnospiraceae bacterium]|nr:amino acid ABC transporter substrate-binding protein [Lachnospiraceae bacterium]